MVRSDPADDGRQQIVDEIDRAGLGGFLGFKAQQDPAIVTPTYVQVWLELWIQDVAEEVPHRAYLRIEEQRSRAKLRERTSYWYGLVDKRDAAVDYYEGLHFHAEPPEHPRPVPHHKVVMNGVLRDWQLEPGLVSVADAVLRLLRVYWERTEGASE